METSERILFVDDDAMVRAAFARSLRRQGFEVDLAGGQDEATKLVGAPVRLAGFLRFELGEGIEKKSEDFAAEVAAQLKK